MSFTATARAALVLGLGLASPALGRTSFADAVAAAWAQTPERLSIEGQRTAYLAQASAGHALLPGASSLTTNYVDDHFIGSNQGYTTYQGTLSTPVWLPGEGGATVRRADAELARVDANGAVTHLAVARQVLQVSASALLAQEELAIAGQQLRQARTLSADLAKTTRVGESPLIDAQAVEGELASATVAQSDAEANLEGALAELRVLTGADAVPDLAPPAGVTALTRVPPSAEAVEDTPEVLAARRTVEAADANLRLVRVSDRADPEVGLQAIHEKQFGSPWDTRVGVQLVIPFASRARNLPRIADAQSRLAAAEAELERTRRRLTVDDARAWASLQAARRATAVTAKAARVLDERAASIERGWRLGEMPVIEVIRARTLAFDAQARAVRSTVMADTAAWQLSLDEGRLP